MRVRPLAAFIALCSFACGGPQPPAPAAAVASIAPPSAGPEVAAPEAAPPVAVAPSAPELGPLPPSLERPSEIVCSFRSASFRGRLPGTQLALRDGGKPFASLWGTVVADVHLPPGAASRNVVIEAAASGVSVRGFAPAEAIELRPSKGFVLDDVAIVTPTAALAIVSAKDGHVEVRLPRPDELASKDRTLEATRPCDDLGLDEVKFSPDIVVFADRKGRTMVLKEGTTAVRLAPGGRALGAFSTKERAHVKVYDTSGGMSHVTWPVDDVVLFGWVDSNRLESPHGGIGGGGRGGMGTVRRGGRAALARVVCSYDVPLVAEVDGDRAVVGRIVAGTWIDIRAWDTEADPFASVDVDRAAIMPMNEARWLARGDELRTCKAEPIDE